MSEQSKTTPRLDTGEPINVREWPDGGFEAVVTADGIASECHAIGDTQDAAIRRLRDFVGGIRWRRANVG